MKRLSFAFVVVALGVVVACGGSTSSESDTFTWETAEDQAEPVDTTPPPEDVVPEYVPAGQGVLAFVEQFGDDNKTCVQKDLCTFNVSFNGDRSLQVLYKEDGAAKENVPLKFEVIEDPQAVGKMAVATVYTDASGIATATVKVVKALPTTFKVKVTVAGSGGASVEPIFFAIVAQAKVQAFLTVSFEYAGQRIFDGVKVYLYKNASTTAADIQCSKMDPLDLPTADLEKGPVQLNQTVKFELLPGLEDESQQRYTICARGEKADGSPMTYGCNDADGLVSITSTKHVAIVLNDISPRIAGSYDVETELDLLSPLPENVENIVGTVLDFFERPSASLLRLVCLIQNDTLQDLCGYVFDDPANPDVMGLTTVGEIVLELIDAYLAAYVEEWTGTDIIGIGEDVRDLIRQLTLVATYDLNAEPGEDGTIAASDTAASWHSVTFRWTYGLECQPNDDACGRIVFNIQSIGQNPITATFPATVSTAQGYLELGIGEHSLNLHYGALLNYILQKVVLPRVFGDGSDGLPVVDSYEKLIKSLLGGGKECLNPAAGQKTCCQTFTDNVIAKAGDAIPETLLANACESLIALGANYLETKLTELDLDTGKNLFLKTPDGLPCKVYDTNSDMKIDSWGKKEPAADRCKWDIQLEVFGAQTAIDKNNFFGYEHQ